MKRLLLGDEAIAQGALDAGLSGVYAYPGTPSTEITEFIQGSPLAIERDVHRRWCTNEKTAMETALGMSYMGKRFSNSCSLEKWESNIGNNMLSHENVIDITDKQMAEDRMIFGLRMTDGIDLDEINANFPKINVDIIKKFFDSLKENKLAKINNSHISLTADGLLVADAISVEILNIMSK